MNKVFSIVIMLLSLCIIALSQVNEIKLLPSIGFQNDNFGQSVSIDGDCALVGAPGAEKVFIFKKSSANWIENDILTGPNNPSGAIMDPGFGFSVCISGDYAIVGAPFHVEGPWMGYYGAAYIFFRNDTSWVLQEKILPQNGFQYNLFGWSVAISPSFAVIGEPGHSKTYIYKRNGENWAINSTLSDGYRFGESVSIFNNYASIGTVGGGMLNPGQGSAYIFFNNGGNWTQQALVQASDSSDIDGFGEAVSISSSNMIAGDDKALNSDSISTGAAYIFNRQDTSWTEVQKITALDGSLGDLFGYEVSISGDYAIISAPEDQDKGSNSGSAYVFRNDGVNWVQKNKLLASDGTAYDNFGISVSISGDDVIVGANGNDDNGNNSGSAYIYSDLSTDIANEHSKSTLTFHLAQNYPNPFNPVTHIRYGILKASQVKIEVYNSLGQSVAEILNEHKPPDYHTIQFDGSYLASGVYYYRIKAGSFVQVKKMLLVR